MYNTAIQAVRLILVNTSIEFNHPGRHTNKNLFRSVYHDLVHYPFNLLQVS